MAILGREGTPGETRFFERPQFTWVARIGGIITFVLLYQFTNML